MTSPVYNDPFFVAVEAAGIEAPVLELVGPKPATPRPPRRTSFKVRDKGVLRMMAVLKELHIFTPTDSWIAVNLGIEKWQVSESLKRLRASGWVAGRTITEQGWTVLGVSE